MVHLLSLIEAEEENDVIPVQAQKPELEDTPQSDRVTVEIAKESSEDEAESPPPVSHRPQRIRRPPERFGFPVYF